MDTAAEIVPANNIKFSQLCSVLEQLYKQKKQKQKQYNILTNFINESRLNFSSLIVQKNCTFFPVLRLLLPDEERERNAYNLKEKKLGNLLVDVLALRKNSNDCHKLTDLRFMPNNALGGDFASIAYYIINRRIGNTTSDLTVGDINNILDKIASAEIGNKGQSLRETFSYVIRILSAEETKWFLRIILKDLKLSMKRHTILAAFHPDAPELHKNLGNLSKVCEELQDGNTRSLVIGVKLFYAISPMLSERMDVTNISQITLNNTYHIEDKFDGERFQMHMENGVFEYFSRKGFSYSDKYGKTYDSGMLTPYLKGCFSEAATSFILDGEMMGWHKEYQYFGSKGMSFDIKKVTENSKYRPCFCVFDILYYNGKSLVGSAEQGGTMLKERLKILNILFKEITGVIHLSKRKYVEESLDVLNALNKAIENQDEGIVVKHLYSYYIPHLRNSGWYKIKPEYTDSAMTDLDLVIVGADKAENRKQGEAKSFHVACLDNQEDVRRWLCVGRVSSGLTFEQRAELCARLSLDWNSTRTTPPPPCLVFGNEIPDFWIFPGRSVIVKVRATELIRSRSYGTEYTLRFPRITELHDKPVLDILTLQEFNGLISGNKAVVKLGTKTITEEQIGSTEIKTAKKRTGNVLQVPERFRTKWSNTEVSSNSKVKETSKALAGRKICILSDDEKCTRAKLIEIVESHGGKAVANIVPDIWCSVAGTLNVRIRSMIEAETADIATTTWLRSLPRSWTLCSHSPLDMLSMKHETKLALSVDYDTFGDSYTDPIDETLLRKCFMRMDNRNMKVYLTTQEKINIDEQLFGDCNPYSFLRACSIHVVNSPLREIQARMYGAVVREITSNLTHVIVDKNNIKDIEFAKNNTDALVVSEDWLNQCFLNRKRVAEIDFLL